MKILIKLFFFPLSFCLWLILAGWIVGLRHPGSRRGRNLLLSGVLLLYLFSTHLLPSLLLRPLERYYPALGSEVIAPHTNAQILVLGAPVYGDAALPFTSQGSHHFMERMLEAARLAHQLPDSKLTLSLPGPGDVESKLDFVRQWAVLYGIHEDRIQSITDAVNTRDEARKMLPGLNDRPLILVSSASHLPRAMMIFRQEGAVPTPAPCGHAIKEPLHMEWQFLVPSANELANSERAIYEYLGLIKARLGW